MPFKQKMFGRYEFTGKMKDWMDTFQQWYQQDTVGHSVKFDKYFGQMFIWYFIEFLENWKKESRLADVQQLNAIKFVWDTKPELRQTAEYDAINYIAEHVSIAEMRQMGTQARAFAKKQLGL